MSPFSFSGGEAFHETDCCSAASKPNHDQKSWSHSSFRKANIQTCSETLEKVCLRLRRLHHHVDARTICAPGAQHSDYAATILSCPKFQHVFHSVRQAEPPRWLCRQRHGEPSKWDTAITARWLSRHEPKTTEISVSFERSTDLESKKGVPRCQGHPFYVNAPLERRRIWSHMPLLRSSHQPKLLLKRCKDCGLHVATRFL